MRYTYKSNVFCARCAHFFFPLPSPGAMRGCDAAAWMDTRGSKRDDNPVATGSLAQPTPYDMERFARQPVSSPARVTTKGPPG